MFLVLNKEKILSYIIAVSAVALLFVFATGIYSNPKEQSVSVSTNPSKQLPIYCVDTTENKVALTINCAWNADDIDSILETLSKHNCKVTFFVVGDWVTKYPDAVKKIYDAGHEIGNHSDSHPHVNNMTLENNVDQIKKCSDKVEAITGSKTRLYRGPYGEYNDTVIEAAKKSNHLAIQWSIDSLDYKALTCEQMWERIEPKLSAGSIILMHNGTENTALSLDTLLSNIKEKGFEVVKVSDIVYPSNFTIDNNGVQHKN